MKTVEYEYFPPPYEEEYEEPKMTCTDKLFCRGPTGSETLKRLITPPMEIRSREEEVTEDQSIYKCYRTS